MKITMLGTGHAVVTNVYNTCYVFTDENCNDEEKYFLVDAGGGSQILSQLNKADIDLMNIHEIFLTHQHIDHSLGMVWIARIICSAMLRGRYQGECHVYGHKEVLEKLDSVCRMLLDRESVMLDTRFQMIPVEDGEKRTINGKQFTFFDIGSTKVRQFGYSMVLPDGRKLTCCGDEPYNEAYERKYAEGADWLLHEAFCLYRNRDLYHPYQAHHSTARDAGESAENLDVKNLLLYHTEDHDIPNRKEEYTMEAKSVYHGNIYVPLDLEIIEL